MNLIARFKEWRKRRHYRKRQMEFIRTLIENDLRWLSVHPAGKILLERYQKAVSPDWHEHSFEDPYSLRVRLGWCPHHKNPKGK